ncbi:hypothetical protein K458DRAFT_29970 [Lentithecium fluviatile CBS 122367]|uniref:Uncharacterized protein n=1 Tax=Lentithecium fluviatile CBS 122367 TaxID=1168545 RepID=A0A6G1J1B0_9PLEO|nr:hypothetical protein K458DRAFT_29970 [Lentithecium fluviatile CBS 122367]
MCRVEERVYIGSDGRRQIFEDKFPCDKSHRGKLCSKVKRRTTEYFPKQPPPIISRDDASSPLSSNNPPTPPAGTGSYLVEERRPSITGARPSTRDSKIVIEFGGSRKDGKSKKYPLVTVSNKAYKRSSLGGTSVTSNEGAIESPGSEASYTIRTGFADVPVPPTDHLGQSQGYRTRHDVPQSHHRHVSSSSSHTTSSQPPSLYATSEPESPSTSARQLPSYPRTIVHNPPPGVAPLSPNASRATAPSPSYRTNTVAPRKPSRDNIGADGLTPLDYSDFVDRSASSQASSGRAAAPEITDRAADRERRRKRKEDERKRQEEEDRVYAAKVLAEELDKQEEVKQVRFQLGRAEDRANQRNENKTAESEKRRAEDREEARRRKKGHEERPPTKKPEREKTKPPTREYKRSGHHSRRSSITQADIDERNRLRLQDEAQMALERKATEEREREERAAELRQQQQMNGYYDPRGGDRYPISNSSSGVGRRGSVSGRRPSVSGNPPAVGGLGRSNSTRRVSIIQPTPPVNLPALTTQFSPPPPQQQYSTRPPSSHYQNPPPVFSPGSYSSSSRPPSARHASSHENPFAQPPTRTSHTSQDSNPFALPPTRNVHLTQHDNPFAAQPSVLQPPPEVRRDAWDSRDLRDALPRPPNQNHHAQPRRGEEVINTRPRDHVRAQQATRNLGAVQGTVPGFEDDYESSSEEEDQKLAGKGARMGFGKSRRY